MILLDTNVLSELLRPRPARTVLAWFAGHRPETLWTSTVAQAEMMLGARLLPAGRRRSTLEAALQAMFEQDFAGRVLAFDAAAVPHYVEVVAARRAAGRPISQFDAQIAAIARGHRMQLATRNMADFEGCGVGMVDPWR